MFKMLKRYGFKHVLRHARRKHAIYTPREKLTKRYDSKLYSLIGTEAYYKLYKLSPEEAAAKGLI